MWKGEGRDFGTNVVQSILIVHGRPGRELGLLPILGLPPHSRAFPSLYMCPFLAVFFFSLTPDCAPFGVNRAHGPRPQDKAFNAPYPECQDLIGLEGGELLR